MLKTHLPNVLTYLRHRITNATAEGLNSTIQWIRYTARGFRNRENFTLKPEEPKCESVGYPPELGRDRRARFGQPAVAPRGLSFILARRRRREYCLYR